MVGRGRGGKEERKNRVGRGRGEGGREEENKKGRRRKRGREPLYLEMAFMSNVSTTFNFLPVGGKVTFISLLRYVARYLFSVTSKN
jgi:hypothetical protein